MSNLIELIESWFSEQCSRNWGAEYGISISTIANPGWRLSVDLSETELIDRPFDPIIIERSEEDWLHCFVRDNKFEGACGVHNLHEVISVFITWSAAATVS